MKHQSTPDITSTSDRYIVDYYTNPSNSTNPVYQRKITYPGHIWLPVNVKGNRKDNKRCNKCGGKTKLVYCTICHHYYCFDYNSNNKTSATS